MEKHRCKLCYRKFANGRALGGHMRSHMMNLPIHSKPGLRPGFEGDSSPSPPQTPSYSSSSGSEPEEGEIVVKGKLLCKLSDHDPKKSVKLVENNHNNMSGSFVGVDNDAAGSSSVTLQDRESETESSRNVTRRRSKRTRKPASLIIQYGKDYDQSHDDDYDDVDQDYKLLRDDCYNNNNDVDQQPGSSISEVTSEEDVAFCLMMMSRDKWNNVNKHGYGYGHRQRHEKECNNKNVGIIYKGDVTIVSGNNSQQQQKKRYKCETCNKVFRSYQALGGHRASHKKLRLAAAEKGFNDDDDNNEVVVIEEEKKIHECPICYRVFASGQALGGHKRSHVTANGGIDNNNNNINPVQLQVVQSPKKKKITSGNFIDLNLPAPVDDEDENISHTAFSAVSDVHL